MPDIVYLDICCFKRPFDDASQERVRREAEAVAAVVEASVAGRVQLAQSPAHDFENDRNPREDRRLATRLWLDAAEIRVTTTADTGERARALVALGFRPLDALHLAFAEQAHAAWFITTDDGLLRRAHSHSDQIWLKVVKPDEFPFPSKEENP